ncbi:MAG: hypothetical protein ACI4WD_06940 [Lactococcus garvieae]
MTPGTYGVREDGTSEIDEEIRRLSFAGSRTRKLSSCADGSWGKGASTKGGHVLWPT